jgi:hypothetical protein
MVSRRISALRALADRPGTEHEGVVAREMLARLEAKGTEGYRDDEMEYLAKFRAHMRGEISLDEFLKCFRSPKPEERWTCPCGDTITRDGICRNVIRHAAVQTKIRTTFSKGDRVFYNYWAYPPNCPGAVQGYVKLQPDKGTFPWAWLRVKFDHLKSPLNVPVWSDKGMHLSHEPVGDTALERLDPIGYHIRKGTHG